MTERLTCRDCGRTIKRPLRRGPKPRLCAPCSVAWANAYLRTPKARAYRRAYRKTPKARAYHRAYYLRVTKPARERARRRTNAGR